MSAAEVAAFLASELVVTVATLGPRGWPHLMPLWFVVRDEELWGWTYGRSQKVRNLERDPRCTLQVEAGGGAYSQLRGVMVEAEAVIHRDLDTVAGVGADLAVRYGGADLDEGARSALAAQRQSASRCSSSPAARRPGTIESSAAVRTSRQRGRR